MINTLLKPVDAFLNHITMYRLVLYYCAALLMGDFALGLFKLSPHDPAKLAFTAAIIVGVSWITNRALSLATRIPANVESWWITALIIALVVPPVGPGKWLPIAGVAVAAAVAIISKFALALNRKHIFNPVALGVVVSAFAAAPATWWIGSAQWLLPIVIGGGLLILRKVQRFEMFVVYMLAYLTMSLIGAGVDGYGDVFHDALLGSHMLFLGFAMLTEPMTAPAAKWPSLAFGGLVGLIASPAFHIGEFYPTPEMGLLLGNAFAWAVNPKFRFKLTLARIEKTAAGCYDYVFHSTRPVGNKPGQYLDWTIPALRADDRGNRRTFTLASSPNEKEVRLGVKFYPNPSSYKQAMLQMKPGDVVYGSQLGGDFTLPEGDDKFAFIAGGIGVTPFRAMIQHMIEMRDARPATLFYGNNRPSEIAYVDVFNRAEREIGLRSVYAVAEGGAGSSNFHQGFIDADLIMREMPDYAERLFYISGPRGMVLKFEQVLAELGIARHRIKTDFFPGFA